MDSEHIVIIILIVVVLGIGIFLVVRSLKTKDKSGKSPAPSEPTDLPDPSDVPPEDAYVPFETPPDTTYKWFPERHAYLLPYDDLDFSKPFHRWMYYYYPEYYYPHYASMWPYHYPKRRYYGYYNPSRKLYYDRYRHWWEHAPKARGTVKIRTPPGSPSRVRKHPASYISKPRDPHINTLTYPTKQSGFAGGRWSSGPFDLWSKRTSASPGWSETLHRGSQWFTDGKAKVSGLTSNKMGGFGGGSKSYGPSIGRLGKNLEKFESKLGYFVENINHTDEGAKYFDGGIEHFTSKIGYFVDSIGHFDEGAKYYDGGTEHFNGDDSSSGGTVIQGTFIPEGSSPLAGMQGTLIFAPQSAVGPLTQPVPTETTAYMPTQQYVTDSRLMNDQQPPQAILPTAASISQQAKSALGVGAATSAQPISPTMAVSTTPSTPSIPPPSTTPSMPTSTTPSTTPSMPTSTTPSIPASTQPPPTGVPAAGATSTQAPANVKPISTPVSSIVSPLANPPSTNPVMTVRPIGGPSSLTRSTMPNTRAITPRSTSRGGGGGRSGGGHSGGGGKQHFRPNIGREHFCFVGETNTVNIANPIQPYDDMKQATSLPYARYNSRLCDDLL